MPRKHRQVPFSQTRTTTPTPTTSSWNKAAFPPTPHPFRSISPEPSACSSSPSGWTPPCSARENPPGFSALPHWNATGPLPQWVPDGTILTGSKSNLKNHRGLATTAAASWSYHFSGDGLHKGSGDERLLNGMIRTQRTASINTAAIGQPDRNSLRHLRPARLRRPYLSERPRRAAAGQ